MHFPYPAWYDAWYDILGLRRASPTVKLAYAVHHKWEADRLFMFVSAYMDVSGSPDESSLIVLSGYVGKLGQWRAFDAKWDRMKKKFDIPYVRGKELYHRQGPFKHWNNDKAGCLVDHINKIVDKHTICGFSIRIDKQDFLDYYVSNAGKNRGALDSMYGVCFRYCLSILLVTVEDALKGKDFHIHLIVESGDKNTGAACDIFHEMKKWAVPGYSEKFNEITIGDKEKYPGL